MADQHSNENFRQEPSAVPLDNLDASLQQDSETLKKIQSALKAAQEASEKLASATHDASSALEKYAADTHESAQKSQAFMQPLVASSDVSQDEVQAAVIPDVVPAVSAPATPSVSPPAVAPEVLAAEVQSGDDIVFLAKEKESIPATPSQTGQVYFTTTISNIDPNAPAPLYVPPGYAPVPTIQSVNPVLTNTSAVVVPSVGNPPMAQDSRGLDFTGAVIAPSLDAGGTAQGETVSGSFAPSGFFSQGTTSMEAAQDFSTLIDTRPPTPKAPYLIYIILGCICAGIISGLVFLVPQQETLEASSLFMPFIVLGALLFVVGVFMTLPVWLVSRGRIADHKGLFARAFLRSSFSTILVMFLWFEAIIISDLFRLGQLSL